LLLKNIFKKVIMTGATGFLGFALLNELVANNTEVIALCRPNSRGRARVDRIPNVTVIETQLTDNIKMPSGYYDVFYHLAWEGGRNDFNEQYKNVGITLNCLKSAASSGCGRFICCGSQAEYGEVSRLITENTPTNPTTSYGACKAAAYHLSLDLAKRLGIEHTWVRVFSVYGPSDNPNTLIMSLIRELRSNGSAKLDTDGSQIWNYLYETDAARALRLIGECERNGAIFNLAGNNNKPLREYVDELRQLFAPNAVITYGVQKSGINLNVSIEKVQQAIDWSPNVTFLEGVANMLKFPPSQTIMVRA
jgi:nucleoside-diphosphate-sugar epimerase